MKLKRKKGNSNDEASEKFKELKEYMLMNSSDSMIAAMLTQDMLLKNHQQRQKQQEEESSKEEKEWNGIAGTNHLGSYFPTTPKESISLGTGLWEQIKPHQGNQYFPVLPKEARKALEKLEKINQKKHDRREVPWKKK